MVQMVILKSKMKFESVKKRLYTLYSENSITVNYCICQVTPLLSEEIILLGLCSMSFVFTNGYTGNDKLTFNNSCRQIYIFILFGNLLK